MSRASLWLQGCLEWGSVDQGCLEWGSVDLLLDQDAQSPRQPEAPPESYLQAQAHVPVRALP